METFIANLKRAIRNRETVTIGGGDFSGQELKAVADALVAAQARAGLETQSMTGLMVSLDDGETWQSSGGVRVMFHDAHEGDDGMQNLLLNVTTEGVILDLQDQESGEVVRTASLLIEDLVAKTY